MECLDSFREMSSKDGLPSLQDYFSAEPQANENLLVEYLRLAEPVIDDFGPRCPGLRRRIRHEIFCHLL